MKKKYTEPEFEYVKFSFDSIMYELNPSETYESSFNEDAEDFTLDW